MNLEFPFRLAQGSHSERCSRSQVPSRPTQAQIFKTMRTQVNTTHPVLDQSGSRQTTSSRLEFDSPRPGLGWLRWGRPIGPLLLNPAKPSRDTEKPPQETRCCKTRTAATPVEAWRFGCGVERYLPFRAVAVALLLTWAFLSGRLHAQTYCNVAGSIIGRSGPAVGIWIPFGAGQVLRVQLPPGGYRVQLDGSMRWAWGWGGASAACGMSFRMALGGQATISLPAGGDSWVFAVADTPVTVGDFTHERVTDSFQFGGFGVVIPSRRPTRPEVVQVARCSPTGPVPLRALAAPIPKGFSCRSVWRETDP